jgi:hypothetical protein
MMIWKQQVLDYFEGLFYAIYDDNHIEDSKWLNNDYLQ